MPGSPRIHAGRRRRFAARPSLAPVALLAASLAAAFGTGCEVEPGIGLADDLDAMIDGALDGALDAGAADGAIGNASLTLPPSLARVVDTGRLFAVIDIGGTTHRLDRPDALGRWTFRQELAGTEAVDLVVTWWYTVERSEAGAIRLATLRTEVPPFSGDFAFSVDSDAYESVFDVDGVFDDDGDGATNLEEVVRGSDPLPDAGPIPPPRPPGDDGDPAALADAPGSDFYRPANNTARVRGTVLGDGNRSNDELARPLPFEVEVAEAGLALVGARAMAFGDTDSSVVLAVANRSTETRCFVQIDYTVESAGAPPSSGTTFVSGTTARGAGGYVSNCIEPGARAFALLIPERPFDDVESLTVDALSSADTLDFEPVDGTIVEPVSYRLDGLGVAFLFANRSPDPLELSGFQGVLLDDTGLPVAFTVAIPSDGSLAPGEEIEVSAPVLFAGSVNTVRVVALVRTPAE